MQTPEEWEKELWKEMTKDVLPRAVAAK